MNLLKELTIKNLKSNKKRTIVTIIGIILSIALICAVACMFFSCRSSLITYETNIKGNFHYVFYDVAKEDLETFQLNKEIDSFDVSSNIGYAKLEGIQNEFKPYVFIKAIDKDAASNLTINLIEGRLPQNNQEIIIPEHLETNGRLKLKIGDTLTLDVGKRINLEGDELSQTNPYSLEAGEEVVDTKPYTYKIVGIMKRPSNLIENYQAPGYTMITLLDNYAHNLDVYVRFTKKALKEPYKSAAHILEVNENIYDSYYNPQKGSIEDYEEAGKELSKAKYLSDSNSYLITLETGITGDSTLMALGTASLIVIIIIIFTSVFCIKNSFEISCMERVKEYGMLRSIGATKKQIKKSVYYEALILGLISIPLGILSGVLASYILIIISNYLLKSALLDTIILRFSFSYLALIISVVLGFITVFLSALKSANKSSKISPIMAIRQNDEIKINKNKVKSPRLINYLFGIGGEISYKNLKRSRKKYRTTVISIVVCSAVFIGLTSFTNYIFKTLSLEFNSYQYNITATIRNIESIDEIKPKLEQLKVLNEVEEFSYTLYNYYGLILRNFEDYYTSEYQKLIDKGELAYAYSEDEIGKFDYLKISFVDDAYFKKYLEELNIDYESNKENFIFINKCYATLREGKTYEVIPYKFKGGDIISGDINDVLSQVKIIKATSKVPLYMNNNNYEVELIGNMDYIEKYHIDDKGISIYLISNNTKKTQKDIEEIFKDYDFFVTNMEDEVSQIKSLFILISIFLYGFITVIALIGITNIFNTITTNMNLRRREFAMLKSIGMTKNEFNRMIRLESLFYGTKALFIGIPLGIILSLLIYKYIIDGDVYLRYEIPIIPIILTTLVVYLLIFIIMKYSIKKINKQNMIETIRNENI